MVAAKNLNPFYQIKKLYNWVLKWSDHKHNTKALSAVAFAESSFFLIPPDVLLITMGASRPKKSLQYALIATLFSVLGGLFGYWIGMNFWDSVSHLFIGKIIKPEHFELVKTQFTANAFIAIFIAGFTPIPYKVFTLTAGVVGLPLIPFIAGSLLGRSMRFFIISGLLFFFGENMKKWIEKHFETFTFVCTALLIAIIYFVKMR